MDWRLDHVVVAGQDLERLQSAFAEVGLPADYGGEHAHGITHNCILGFHDGSYLELIAKLENEKSPWWDQYLDADAGPAAWAIAVDDIESATEELTSRGIAVDQPTHHLRERPDGRRIEWEMATVTGELGTSVPFLIHDHTPRSDRVYPTDDRADIEITGVSEVIVGVEDLSKATSRFQKFFNADQPVISDRNLFGVPGARFEDVPVTLIHAMEDEEITRRIKRFGDCLIGFLFDTKENADLTTGSTEDWFDATVSFVDVDVYGWYGFVE